jgi:hypothetical protein
MAESNKFECGGFSFQVERLPTKRSLKGLRLVGSVVLPALGAGAAAKEGSIGDAIERAVAGLDCLPDILDLFVPHTKYVGPTDKLVPLEAFVDTVFSGKPKTCMQFIVKCVQLEYADFLDGISLSPEDSEFLKGLGLLSSNSPTGSTKTG